MPSHPDRVRKNYDDKSSPKAPTRAPERPPARRGPRTARDKKKRINKNQTFLSVFL